MSLAFLHKADVMHGCSFPLSRNNFVGNKYAWLYIGEEVKSAIEIQEVAKDVVKRIGARQKARKSA